MWYQLYIDYEEVKYKISKVRASKKFEPFLEDLEKKSENDSTICYEAHCYDGKYYFSKNREALKRKLKELGYNYREQLNFTIRNNESIIEKLEQKIENLQKENQRKKALSCNILKEFCDAVYDETELLKYNMHRLYLLDDDAKKIKDNLKLNDKLEYIKYFCTDFLYLDKTHIYRKRDKFGHFIDRFWYASNPDDNIEIKIDPKDYRIITAYLK